jgi:flagellar hook-associated protein 2
VTVNFLAAANLSSGALTRGKDLLYTINAGGQLTSHSNTIDGAASGLPGLSVTALKQGTGTSVDVSSDTGTIQTAITGFVSEYNTVQTMIDNMTASSTDASGKVTTNTLSGQSDATEMASKLRTLVARQFSGITSTVKQLDAMGIRSNGNNNTLAVSDISALTKALTNNLSDVKALFSDPTSGLAAQMDSYITTVIGNTAGNAPGPVVTGSLLARTGDLTKQSAAIDTQIANMETKITADQARMNAEFVAMETAASALNTQMSYIKNL